MKEDIKTSIKKGALCIAGILLTITITLPSSIFILDPNIPGTIVEKFTTVTDSISGKYVNDNAYDIFYRQYITTVREMLW